MIQYLCQCCCHEAGLQPKSVLAKARRFSNRWVAYCTECLADEHHVNLEWNIRDLERADGEPTPNKT